MDPEVPCPLISPRAADSSAKRRRVAVRGAERAQLARFYCPFHPWLSSHNFRWPCVCFVLRSVSMHIFLFVCTIKFLSLSTHLLWECRTYIQLETCIMNVFVLIARCQLLLIHVSLSPTSLHPDRFEAHLMCYVISFINTSV